jgi:hypothetical protein
MLFDIAPNLGYTVERFEVPHEAATTMPNGAFHGKQREAWDFIRARIDQDLPCYAWELSHIPAYYVITGYDNEGYTYSGWDPETQGTCPWDKLGAFDVRMLAVNCVRPGKSAPDHKAVKDALAYVLARVERPDGWAVGANYRTGLPAYEMWAEALETGRANLDGEAYLNVVWRESREMAVEFLEEARMRLSGRCDAAFDDAIGHYTTVRNKLRALTELYPERPDGWDWQTTFASPEGAQLIREAAVTEKLGVACLHRVVNRL